MKLTELRAHWVGPHLEVHATLGESEYCERFSPSEAAELGTLGCIAHTINSARQTAAFAASPQLREGAAAALLDPEGWPSPTPTLLEVIEGLCSPLPDDTPVLVLTTAEEYRDELRPASRFIDWCARMSVEHRHGDAELYRGLSLCLAIVTDAWLAQQDRPDHAMAVLKTRLREPPHLLRGIYDERGDVLFAPRPL